MIRKTSRTSHISNTALAVIFLITRSNAVIFLRMRLFFSQTLYRVDKLCVRRVFGKQGVRGNKAGGRLLGSRFRGNDWKVIGYAKGDLFTPILPSPIKGEGDFIEYRSDGGVGFRIGCWRLPRNDNVCNLIDWILACASTTKWGPGMTGSALLTT